MAKDKEHEPKQPEPAKSTEPVVDPRDAKIAELESALVRIEKQLNAGAVNSVDAVQQRKSEAELEAAKIQVAKGRKQITQEAADKAFPGGKHRYLCHLPDGNDLPEIGIGADNEVDAAARYLSVCGVKSSEKQVTVVKA